MPDFPANPRNPAPQNGAWLRALAGIDESALLDWVEGNLAPEAQADLAAAHPSLVPLVAQMRRDRAVLASTIADARAPAGLEERLTAALERDALLGLAEGQPVSEALPISQVAKPKRPRPPWMSSMPKLATAAGLTLLVTGSALLIMRAGSGPGAAPGGSGGEPKVATTTPPHEPPSPAAGTGNEATYASKVAGEITPQPMEAEHSATAGASVAQTPLILADQGSDMDDARALALAREGRLVIRLIEVGPGALARLASSKRGAARPWHIAQDLPESTLAVLAPASPTPQAERSARALAGAAPHALVQPIPYALPQAAPPIQAPTAVGFEVSARADEATIKALRESLARTTGALVCFEESSTPFRTPAPRSSETVLWWTRAPSAWTPRAQIPLVVELR